MVTSILKKKRKKRTKEKKRKKRKDNNLNPRKLTLNIRTEYCFPPIKASSSMFSYIGYIKRKVY